MLIDQHTFVNMPNEDFTRLVESRGPLIAAFPINGTRRWFQLKVLVGQFDGDSNSYLQTMEHQHIAMYRLFFDHGVHTLLTPIFGPDLLRRGEEYIRLAVEGMARLATEPHFMDFYDAYQVRVRFYGDYKRFFTNTPYADLIGLLDQVIERTRSHDKNRLFFGLFANDPAERIAEISVRYYQQHRCLPDRRTLVTSYYGEYIDPVNFFIGFDRLSAFDMPLLATGEEDLYFTVSPSLDLTARQLRQILYDHLYTRRTPEPDYETLSPNDLKWMQSFYANNHECTLGLGSLKGGVWYPIPGVIWPPENKATMEHHDE